MSTDLNRIRAKLDNLIEDGTGDPQDVMDRLLDIRRLLGRYDVPPARMPSGDRVGGYDGAKRLVDEAAASHGVAAAHARIDQDRADTIYLRRSERDLVLEIIARIRPDLPHADRLWARSAISDKLTAISRILADPAPLTPAEQAEEAKRRG